MRLVFAVWAKGKTAPRPPWMVYRFHAHASTAAGQNVPSPVADTNVVDGGSTVRAQVYEER